MSVEKHQLVQGVAHDISVTLTEAQVFVADMSLSDDVTAYMRFPDGTTSDTDTVDLTVAGTNLATAVIIISFTALDSAEWPVGPCKLVIIRDGVYHLNDHMEVIIL